MPARKFLYIVAGIIVLMLGSALAYRMWGQQMINAVMVPTAPFTEPKPRTAEDYAKPDLWIARPDQSSDNPALWLPKGAWQPAVPGHAAIFFVHPTSYLSPFNKAHWNATPNDGETNLLARQFVMGQASALTSAGKVWAPRYRQAHFGAFLQQSANRDKAIQAAYRDVEAAFAAFLAANPDGPIILAGHSQGSLLLMRLMADHVSGTPVAARIAAAYVVGWPVSLAHDLPKMGLPACTKADEGGCVLSWQSFAEPADLSQVRAAMNSFAGLDGKDRSGSAILCINPLTGSPDSRAEAARNFGTLGPAVRPEDAPLYKGLVPARCGTGKEQGFVLIGDPPQMGPFTLPGNNYHVYDYALYWANIRLDASKRLTAFLAR